MADLVRREASGTRTLATGYLTVRSVDDVITSHDVITSYDGLISREALG